MKARPQGATNTLRPLTHSTDSTREQDDMQSTPERWLPIPGFEGRYDVSDLGRVRSWMPYRGTSLPRVMKPALGGTGRYLFVRLNGANGTMKAYVHRLVLLAFCGPPPEGSVTRHLGGNPADNRLVNVVYGTQADNILDCVRHGTHYNASKTHCPQRHEYTETNTRIYMSKNGRARLRYCRACERARSRTRKRPSRARKAA